MLELDFQKLTSLSLVCAHLQTTPDALQSFLGAADRHYRPIELQKRGSRRPRLVFELAPPLHRIHRTIAVALQQHVRAQPEYIQGFRKDRGIRTNAEWHVRAELVVTADIRAFFDHITLRHVRDLFLRLGAGAQPSLLLARLCTFKGAVPQGGPASPAISNLAMPALDEALGKLAPHAKFTRYADDLAFSGDDGTCPSENEIAGVLQLHGFALRPRSYRLQHQRSGQVVTGLSLASATPTLTRRRRRSVERDLYIGAKFGIDAYEYNRLAGTIHSVGGVDRVLWQRWCRSLDKVKLKSKEADDLE